MVRTIISSSNFYKWLKADNLLSRDLTVNFDVEINNTIVDWHYREIKNIVFEEKVIITDAEINSGLAFHNCEFKKGVLFKKVKSTNYNSTYNNTNSSVLFSSCVISTLAFTEGCVFNRGVSIEKETTISNFLCYNTEIVNSGLKIDSSSINRKLDIKGLKGECRIQKSTVQSFFRVSGLFGDFSLVSSKFNGSINLWNISCPNSLTFNYNEFKGKLKIEGCRIKGMYIHGDVFNKKLDFENRDVSDNNLETFCNEIYVTEAKFVEGAEFNGLSKEISKITLRITPELQGVLKFNGWKADELHVSGVNQNLKLLFKNMVFRFVLLNDFTNYNDLSFDKCCAIKNSPLHFLNTNLGSTRFNEFDLNSFDVIRIDNASFDNIKASNVKWFDNNKIEIGSNASEEEKQRGIREVSRQIKHALSSSGNQIDSLLFKAREMQAFRNELKSQGKKYKCADRIIMTVNRLNNYGLSWEKPTLIIFFITLVFYMLMLPIFSEEIYYTPASSIDELMLTFSEFWDKSYVFWQMFNPTRRFSATYGGINSAWLHFLDLFHRLILGIFIFQIIKGFRRFVSK